MSYRVRLSELSVMTVPEQSAALTSLVAKAKGKPNGSLAELDARIRRYEFRYEMSSDRLTEKLKAGEQQETAEISDWLFWLDARHELVAR